MDDRSDGHLLAAWAGGEPLAFDVLVRRYQGPLLRHAAALLGEGRSPEDVVQETFLRLAEKPPRLPAAPPEGSAEPPALAAWLHRVTRNLCLDAMRSERRRRDREERAAAREASSGGLALVEEEDTRQAVEQGLTRLPEDQREVLVLRLFGERSYQEIAEITGKKVGTIGWLISVGLKTLSHELAPLVGDPRSPRTEPVSRLQGGLS